MKLDVARVSNDNVVECLERGLAAIRGGDTVFDLSAVRECNSAAVAMVLAWQREAHERAATLQLVGVSANLVSLAKLYDVEEYFGAKDA
jgi:phospholipid transport system transporter-binding protein